MGLHSSGGGSGKKVILKGHASSEGDRGRILIGGAWDRRTWKGAVAWVATRKNGCN